MLTLQTFVVQGSNTLSTHTVELTSRQKCDPLKKFPNPALATCISYSIKLLKIYIF